MLRYQPRVWHQAAPQYPKEDIDLRAFVSLVLSGIPGTTSFDWQGSLWKVKLYDGLRGAESRNFKVVEQPGTDAHRWKTWLWILDGNRRIGRIVDGFGKVYGSAENPFAVELPMRNTEPRRSGRKWLTSREAAEFLGVELSWFHSNWLDTKQLRSVLLDNGQWKVLASQVYDKKDEIQGHWQGHLAGFQGNDQSNVKPPAHQDEPLTLEQAAILIGVPENHLREHGWLRIKDGAISSAEARDKKRMIHKAYLDEQMAIRRKRVANW